MVFLFPTNMKLAICKKSKIDILPKSALRDDISSIIEKDDIHSRKYGISSDRKTKDDKKSLLSQIRRERTSLI